MRIIPPVEQEIRRAIRDERARDPLLPITKLQERLERQFNREFSRKYLTKLADKVARETLTEIDRAQIEPRLAGIRENYRVMRERLLQIVYWQPPEDTEGAPRAKPPLNKDVIEACKNLVMMDLAILQAEAAAGLYKKPIAEIAKDIRYDPLPGEVRAVIVAAWERGGMLPRPAIEAMVPDAAMK